MCSYTHTKNGIGIIFTWITAVFNIIYYQTSTKANTYWMTHFILLLLFCWRVPLSFSSFPSSLFSPLFVIWIFPVLKIHMKNSNRKPFYKIKHLHVCIPEPIAQAQHFFKKKFLIFSRYNFLSTVEKVEKVLIFHSAYDISQCD